MKNFLILTVTYILLGDCVSGVPKPIVGANKIQKWKKVSKSLNDNQNKWEATSYQYGTTNNYYESYKNPYVLWRTPKKHRSTSDEFIFPDAYEQLVKNDRRNQWNSQFNNQAPATTSFQPNYQATFSQPYPIRQQEQQFRPFQNQPQWVSQHQEQQTQRPIQIPNARPQFSPQYQECMNNCLSTNEYNPVCGTDDTTYSNRQRLQCANRCGRNVQIRQMGSCTSIIPPLCASNPSCQFT